MFIHNYHADVIAVLGAPTPGTDLAFGLELEFSHIDWEVATPPSGVIFKEDSSIGYEGAEMVTVPMLPAEMLGWLNELNLSGFSVDARCGMHVHINRKSLTTEQIARLVNLIEDDIFEGEVVEIAGRDFPNMEYCGKKTDKTKRHRAVNLIRHSTVEIRIFAGTADVSVVRKRIMWLMSLITYASMETGNYGQYLVWANQRDPSWYQAVMAKVEAEAKAKAKAEAKAKAKAQRAEKWASISLAMMDVMPKVACVILGLAVLLPLGVTGMRLMNEPPNTTQQ